MRQRLLNHHQLITNVRLTKNRQHQLLSHFLHQVGAMADVQLHTNDANVQTHHLAVAAG